MKKKQSLVALTVLLLMIALLVNGCGNKLKIPESLTTATTTSAVAGSTVPAARIIFKHTYFSDVSDFVTTITSGYQCLGEVTKIFYVDSPDYSGTPLAFPASDAVDDLDPTTRPAFLKNAAVDVTNTYFPETQSGVVTTDACSYRSNITAPYASYCSDFDVPIAAFPAPTATPAPTALPTPEYAAAGAGTGMYRVHDELCEGQGPILNPDPDVTKTYIGGVNIDIDRTQLGSNEDLLMVVTYHAENKNDETWPATATAPSGATTALRVDLIGTNQSLASIMGMPQPRAYSYYNSPSYPVYMQEIATLQDPYGSLRSEQVYIPLSKNSLVDRIRIERIRGSYILYQVDLYRLGSRE